MKGKILIVTPLVVLISACSTPEAVALNTVCTPANDGKELEVEGYVVSGRSVYCSSTSGLHECGLYLATAPDSDPRDGGSVKVNIKVGDGSNEMDEVRSAKDLRIRADDGSQVDGTRNVRVSGEARVTANVCWITADKIKVA